MRLRDWLPCCDVLQLLSARPSLLLPGEWEHVERAVADLKAIYITDGTTAAIVTAQPALLSQDIPDLVSQLER